MNLCFSMNSYLSTICWWYHGIAVLFFLNIFSCVFCDVSTVIWPSCIHSFYLTCPTMGVYSMNSHWLFNVEYLVNVFEISCHIGTDLYSMKYLHVHALDTGPNDRNAACTLYPVFQRWTALSSSLILCTLLWFDNDSITHAGTFSVQSIVYRAEYRTMKLKHPVWEYSMDVGYRNAPRITAYIQGLRRTNRTAGNHTHLAWKKD